ncbi:citrulline utilization hydrolase CtlX [Hydrotalea sp.]|uniref:citrulline utilization hydrolase CtlX n=1 Tax=Hydrotalea sp. TaxID=2881279 RepID=UPI003D0DE728
MQNTNHLLMIKPVRFTFNEQTAVNNAFQQNEADSSVAIKAANEFNHFAEKLMQHGIDVTIVEDTPEPHTPDSIFPNNWISFHTNGTIVLYPMFAPNRRLERKPDVLNAISKKFSIQHQIDLSYLEDQNQFLEGTGSMVLDREHKIAYACLSPRTDEHALKVFSEKMGYSIVQFHASDKNNMPIYHTNVMMCVADRYVVICLDSIKIKEERKKVEEVIQQSGKKIIPISFEQMEHFAGNMLQVINEKGNKFLVMSTQAYESLNNEQIQQLTSFNTIIHSNISTIEKNGGGSARCMLAEVFLPLKN